MNENDLSDLVSKTKKSGGSKTKCTRAKRARKQVFAMKQFTQLEHRSRKQYFCLCNETNYTISHKQQVTIYPQTGIAHSAVS